MSQEAAPLLKQPGASEMPPPPESLLRTARRYLVGVGLLLGVVLLWTVSNFITNSLETGEKAWNKPFL
jgi:solute carrier family 35 protein F5